MNHVEPETGAAAAVRREQAAKHADRSGLAAAVGTEKAEYLAFPDLQRKVLDDMVVAKMLVDSGDVDDQRGIRRLRGLHVSAQ